MSAATNDGRGKNLFFGDPVEYEEPLKDTCLQYEFVYPEEKNLTRRPRPAPVRIPEDPGAGTR
jgi:hypothetical protein